MLRISRCPGSSVVCHISYKFPPYYKIFEKYFPGGSAHILLLL